MDIDKMLEGFFDKDENQLDDILVEIANQYIGHQIKKGRNYKQILKALDNDIYTAKITEKFEMVAAFEKIKEGFTNIINESLNNETNV